MKVFFLYDKKALTKCICFSLLDSYYNLLNVSIDKMNIMFYLRCSISLISYSFVETIQTSYSSYIFTIQWNAITKFVHNKSPLRTSYSLMLNKYFFILSSPIALIASRAISQEEKYICPMSERVYLSRHTSHLT